MAKENKTPTQERRNVLRKVAATGILGSSGIAHFTTLSAGSGEESTGSEGDETTVGPDMHLPGGGGTGAPEGSFDEAVSKANEESDTSYDFENLDKPSSNKTDLTANDTVLGTDITVDGAAAKVTYKECSGYSHQMVVAEVSITTESAGGIASYSVWLGVSEDGCFYVGDSHDCVELSNSVACHANQFAENPHQYMDEWATIANEIYSFVEEHEQAFVNVGETVVWGIITILILFAMAVGAAFGSAAS